MAQPTVGRKMQIFKNSVLIAGVQEKSLNAVAEGIDITNDDDNGFRTFIDEAGVRSFDIPISGVTKDNELMDLIMDPSNTGFLLSDVTIEYPDAGTGTVISGDVYLGGVEYSGPTADAVKFSATLQSSGPWTKTTNP